MPHVPPFQPDSRLFPFRSRWFESAVGAVHYIDEGPEEAAGGGGGAADPILFLHGNPTWSFLYRGVVIRLRKRFRCVALDYPGFGLSVRPDGYGYTPAEHADVVRALVRHLDLERLTVMGQDWGGPIGMRLALDELPRMRALVMGNTWYWPVDAWHVKAFAWAMSTPFMQRRILERNFFVEPLMGLAVKHTLAPEVLRHYREALPSPKSRVGVAELPRQLLDSDLWLGEIADGVADRLANVPLLLTWGIEDLAFPRSFMGRFRDDFRLTTVTLLEAKHYIQEDAPAQIAAAIQDFLDHPRMAT
jgi:haloalkane dehalogenase